MRKVVVISSNNNPDYFHYAPYQEKAWNSLGWELCIMITHDVNPLDLNLRPYLQHENKPPTSIVQLPHIPELKTGTIAQAGRLYAANYFSDDDVMLMTCDMDLIPLSDYWKPELFDVTIYGHDLTWHSFIPMGYIAMSTKNWRKYMGLTGLTAEDMMRDAKSGVSNYNPFSDKWEEYWDYDWSLVTNKLKPYKDTFKFIDRGQINIAGGTLAKGRIDRFNWEATQNQPEPFIDCHCENNNVKHPVKLEPFLKVFNKFYP